MDAAELDRRFRTCRGWIPPEVATLLVEHGHLGEVRRRAGDWDWYCAREFANVLIGQGRRDAGLEVLAPFVRSGWWEAVGTAAGLLDAWGRADEAIALVRPLVDARDGHALRRLAELLARRGRVDEVIALLGPRAEDRNIAEALVESTAGCGRDQEVAALLPTVAADTWSTRGWEVVGSVARVLERRGRVEEAMALLRAYVHHEGAFYHDVLEDLADMLVRHDRWDELRELPECDDTWVAWRMADALEEQRRVAEAVEALRPFVARGGQFEVAARRERT